MKKIIWLAIPIVLIAIQFIRPDTTVAPVDPAQDFRQVANPPAEIVSILESACYDCHSNETKYPWYSQIAPVSWWVANHVNEGREALNFSTFGMLSPGDRAEVMEESAEKIKEGEMPLPSYTWLGMHPEANLTTAQRELLAGWLNTLGGEGAENKSAGSTGKTDGAPAESEAEKDDD